MRIRDFISISLLLFCGRCLSGCIPDTDEGTGPAVPVWVSPALHDTDVPVDAILRLRLDRHLDADSVTTSSLQLISGPIQKWIMTYYEPVYRELVIWPSVPLRANVDWQLHIAPGLRDMEGRDILEQEVTRFTTGSSETGEKAFENRSYHDDIVPIFDKYCVSCHGGGDAAVAGVDLANAMTLSRTVIQRESAQFPGWQRIVPYRPGKSYLLFKLLDKDIVSGVTMPRAVDMGPGTSLSTEQQKAVSDWIAGGAVF